MPVEVAVTNPGYWSDRSLQLAQLLRSAGEGDGPSTIGAVAIDSANIDGDYRDSTGVIRALDVKGRDITVSATGTLALDETGQSNVSFHAGTPSLAEIGKLVDAPPHRGGAGPERLQVFHPGDRDRPQRSLPFASRKGAISMSKPISREARTK